MTPVRVLKSEPCVFGDRKGDVKFSSFSRLQVLALNPKRGLTTRDQLLKWLRNSEVLKSTYTGYFTPLNSWIEQWYVQKEVGILTTR